jgi:hypothetical protein
MAKTESESPRLPESPSIKKPYEAPRLFVFGDLQEITEGVRMRTMAAAIPTGTSFHDDCQLSSADRIKLTLAATSHSGALITFAVSGHILENDQFPLLTPTAMAW